MKMKTSRHLHRSLTIAAFLLACFTLGTAFAVDPQPNPPNPERRAVAQACRADAERLCAGVERGGGHRMACLRDHAAQLSPACRDGLAELKAARKDSAPK